MDKNIRKLLLTEIYPPRPKSSKSSLKLKAKKRPFSFSPTCYHKTKSKINNYSTSLSILINSSPKKSKNNINSFYKTDFKMISNYNNTINTSKYNPKNHSMKLYKNTIKKINSLDECNNKNLEYKTINNNTQTYTNLTRIFKFKRRNTLTKILEKERKVNNISIYSKKHYKDYINKKLLLNFNLKYHTAFMHKIKTDYAIHHYLNDSSNHERKSKKKKLEEEQKDKINSDFFNINKVSNKILKYFENANKKYSTSGETIDSFFKKYDNQINFIKDIYSVPSFKNKFIKFGDDMFSDKLNKNNYIDQKTWKYLNKVKINLQKIKDEKAKYKLFINEDDKKKLVRNKSEAEDEKFDVINYLVHKKNLQSVVNIPSNKSKELFREIYLKKYKAKIK